MDEVIIFGFFLCVRVCFLLLFYLISKSESMVKRFEESYHFGPLKLLYRLLIHSEEKHMVRLHRGLQEMKDMERHCEEMRRVQVSMG